MRRVLVIEDDKSILENTVEILNFEGYEVAGAPNGEEGLREVREFRPELIICDIMMPKVDGYAVLQTLRRDPELSLIPFIFLTAKASRNDMRYGMDMGADDYLPKPFTTQELLDMVESRLRLKDAHDREVQKRLEDLRSNMVYSLPHELRTPLTGILGYCALLIEDYESMEKAAAVNMLEGVQRAANRLFGLVENYLLYAQLELFTAESNRAGLLRSKPLDGTDLMITEVATNI
ncbi:MAG TPA: response regulator, partial [Aggregatilineales bacterium]|nr:response regulator [Aggregatilineales bacterium]